MIQQRVRVPRVHRRPRKRLRHADYGGGSTDILSMCRAPSASASYLADWAEPCATTVCHHCNEERMEVARRTQTPPLAQPPPLQPPPAPWQPALPAGAAAAAAIADATAVDGTRKSSRGSLQQLMPATADATPQLHQICARLDALEEICGRMETMMMEICAAIGADGAQPQVSQAQAAVNGWQTERSRRSRKRRPQ